MSSGVVLVSVWFYLPRLSKKARNNHVSAVAAIALLLSFRTVCHTPES